MKHVLYRWLFASLLTLTVFACVRGGKLGLDLPRSPQSNCKSWNKLPIHVRLEPSAAHLYSEIDTAMEKWNEAVGRKVFEWAGKTTVEVVFQIGETERDSEAGNVKSKCLLEVVYHTVTIRAGMDDGANEAFAIHELGHVLGMRHSTNEQSVMQWIIAPGLMGPWDDEHQPGFYRITVGDVDVVNQLHPR